MTDTGSPEVWVANDDSVDLARLVSLLWQGKWLIGGVSFLATVVAVIIALMIPNTYRSEALLAPNAEERTGGLAALAAQYSGVASLAGINLSGGSSDKVTLGLEILKSRKFAASFVDEHNILVPLMATKGWDSASGKLIIDGSKYDATNGKWAVEYDRAGKSMPSQQEAFERFSGEVLSVSTDKTTGYIKISVEHHSPLVAKQWVDWLVADINATVMKQEVEQAEQAIAYLENQVRATSISDLQSVFFRLIEEQTKTVMLAKVSPEYLFRTIDPAVVPELKSGPRRTWIALAGLLLGGMLGVVIVLVREKLHSQRR